MGGYELEKIIKHESDAAACFGQAHIRHISTEAHALWTKVAIYCRPCLLGTRSSISAVLSPPRPRSALRRIRLGRSGSIDAAKRVDDDRPQDHHLAPKSAREMACTGASKARVHEYALKGVRRVAAVLACAYAAACLRLGIRYGSDGGSLGRRERGARARLGQDGLQV